MNGRLTLLQPFLHGDVEDRIVAQHAARPTGNTFGVQSQAVILCHVKMWARKAHRTVHRRRASHFGQRRRALRSWAETVVSRRRISFDSVTVSANNDRP